ncbi:hypothetical protein SAY87_029498 [Trapa incisa]|uniref:RING-type domain-containing protein n=1 Tax=Trapa incisa TaxID=236973 RepID=A0AAN7Q997_9MYRT|nr:hypothetical protein SAY87_029498 [Trapa incisa]
MAVQAQYPSNSLLNRKGQEGRIVMDCWLQQQPGGGGGDGGGGEGRFLDHHHQRHVLFTSRGTEDTVTDTRKRGRGASDTIAATNPLTLKQQLQPSQLINLSLLHRNNPIPHHLVSTGLRLSSSKDHHQHQQSLLLPEPVSSISSLISHEDFAAHLKQQRDEMDQYLLLQGEQLRRILAEKRQRHLHALLSAAKVAMLRRLREKEEEVEKATRRNAELEAQAAQLRAEAQEWQAIARAEEAAAASLHARLQQAIIGGVHNRTPTEEEDGRCRGQDAEDAESIYEDSDRVAAVPPGLFCRSCRRKPSAVVLLPCRHLCLCTMCDGAVATCPVCLTGRVSSIEVYFS